MKESQGFSVTRFPIFFFLAEYPGDGSRPQTDSLSGPDLLHDHLPDCADPRRLPEHCQLFQVAVRPSPLVHVESFRVRD